MTNIKRLFRRSAIWSVGLVLAIQYFIGPVHAAGTLQIHAPDGAEIFVDGSKFSQAGEGSEKPIFVEVAPGRHRVEVKKMGFETSQQVVDVPDNDVRKLVFSLSTPQSKVGQEGGPGVGTASAKLGSLRIRTIPVECRIAVSGENISATDGAKRQTDWFLKDIKIGPRDVVIDPVGAGRQLRFSVDIFEGEESLYLVNLLNGTVKDLAKADRDKRLAAKRAAAEEEERQIRLAEKEAESVRQRVAEQQRMAAEQHEFDSSYQAYLNAIRSGQVSMQERARLWQRLCIRWHVNPGAGTALRWENGRVVIEQ